MKECWLDVSAEYMRSIVEFITDELEIKKVKLVGKSMEPTIKCGEILQLQTNVNEIKIGEIITFINNNHLTTHRIKDIFRKNGVEYYVTRGDAEESGEEIISDSDIIGKVINYK